MPVQHGEPTGERRARRVPPWVLGLVACAAALPLFLGGWLLFVDRPLPLGRYLVVGPGCGLLQELPVGTRITGRRGAGTRQLDWVTPTGQGGASVLFLRGANPNAAPGPVAFRGRIVWQAGWIACLSPE